MAQASTEVPKFSIAAAEDSFERHLKAANKAPRTITGYLEAVDQLGRYLAAQGMPRDVTAIRREHIEAWIGGMQELGLRPSSVANRYRSLRVFFNWLVREDEITRSPMEKMPARAVPEIPCRS